VNVPETYVVLVGAVLMTLAGCSTTSAGGSTGSTTTSTQQLVFHSKLPGAKTLPNGQQYVVVSGSRVILPTEDGGAPIDPVRSTGQNVLLTSSGPWPQQLFASSKSPVVFTNVTGVPVTVTFVSSPVKPFVVPPAGGTGSWKPTGLVSVAYKDSHGGSGNLSVDMFPS
jgi:hypothetical protein